MVIDDVFAVIAEGTRREILAALRAGDKSVGTLVQELEVSQPTVSKHLKVLREAGLVSMRAEGQKRYYSLLTGPLDEVVLWLRGFGLQSLQPAEPQPGLAAVGSRAGRGIFATRTTTAPAAVLPPAAAAAAAAGSPAPQDDPRPQPQLGRTVGRAAERAADLLGQLPKFRRRR
ncbi:Transcriptional repressor SdpR [Arthrobacter saudimassiliensis]|uniref:Transcriptional repressor SdpR n=1 Tax=Arthrobacter saudimassiliensis TaxID=1461584 RepID=A0A078MUE3_9MICC|nr:Transcriptional repressor SdpR [Arthrobacter saudimassiliensis]